MTPHAEENTAEEKYRRRIEKAERWLERFGRRRPQLGGAASHPLTTALIARRRRWRFPGITRAFGLFGRALTLIVTALLLLTAFKALFLGAPSAIVFIVLLVLVMLAILLSTRSTHLHELWRRFARGRRDDLLDIWITPLTYGEILAIDAAQACFQGNRAASLLSEATILTIAGLLFTAVHLDKGPDGWTPGGALVAMGVFSFLGSLSFLWDDAFLLGHIRRLHRHLRETHGRKASLSSYYAERLTWAGIGVVIAVIARLVDDWSGTHWGLALLCAAAATVYIGRILLPTWVDRRYARLAAEGNKLYRELAQMYGER
jgi:hypothetical protein